MGERMTRKIKLEGKNLSFSENNIEGFMERVVTKFGNSGKADIPKRYIGRRVYVIISKETE